MACACGLKRKTSAVRQVTKRTGQTPARNVVRKTTKRLIRRPFR